MLISIKRSCQPTNLPDLNQLLGEQYEVYDSGGIGQLDVRAFLKQYGERKNADDISSAWQGGAYMTLRRKDKAARTASPTTADLALVYVSRWKTPRAAEHVCSLLRQCGRIALSHCDLAGSVSACSRIQLPGFYRTNRDRRRTRDRGALGR